MWFRASLAYVVLPYHPSREDASTPINSKNFVPEVQVFAHGMAALLQAAAHLVSIESVERHQFREYLRSLLQDEAGWFLLQPWPTVSQTPDEQNFGDVLQFMDTVGQFPDIGLSYGPGALGRLPGLRRHESDFPSARPEYTDCGLAGPAVADPRCR